MIQLPLKILIWIKMRYFVAKEHMDLWKILFFDNFQDERNARPFTIDELDSHSKTRKIKLAFTEPTVEERENVPQDTILIYIPNAKISTKNKNGVDVDSLYFSGLGLRNETYVEYMFEQLRADVYVTNEQELEDTHFSPKPFKPGRTYPFQRYTTGRAGSVLYFNDVKEFRKNPTESTENSPCSAFDMYISGIDRTTPAITKFYHSFLLHNCRKHPYLVTTAACCLVLAVGFALSKNEKIASFFSSVVERSMQ